jgi:hypothetical protein
MARPLALISASEVVTDADVSGITIVGLEISSTADAVCYVKIYDQAAEPDEANDEPLCFFHAPIGARMVDVPKDGLQIVNNLWVMASGEPDAGATAPSAALNVQVWVA